MSADDTWTRYRRRLIDNEALGFRLDLNHMGLPEGFIRGMEDRFSPAFDAMEALERGAVANPDEQRQVGHYWLRAPDLAPDAEIGDAIRDTRDRVLEFAGRVHRGEVRPERSERFEHLLVIGIGGSALGPQFVADALGGPRDKIAPHFIDNTDPDGIDRVLDRLPIETTLTLVISKSGGTPETRNGMLETERVYSERGLDFGRHAVAITQEGSKLDRFATERRFLDRFPMWDWVGGRTSELSVVGLLPAALQGLDIVELLGGAAAMDELTRSREIGSNPSALLAAAWFHAGDGRGSKDMVVLPYKDRLALFSRYLQQLVMESLGKEKDLDGKTVHQGIAVYGNKGSTDQHAYVQQLREGVPNFFVTFIQVLRDRDGDSLRIEDGITAGDFLCGFLLGTRRALHDNGRASMTITIPDVTARTVGMLIALYERAVGLYASLVNVNAYHQPGVEAGKRAATAVLDLQRELVSALRDLGAAGGTCVDVARAAGTDDIETAFAVLEHLAANPERGVTRKTGATLPETTYRMEKTDA